MIALSLTDKKIATRALFVQDTFDHFLVKEISITTGQTYHIDGRIQKEYYNTDELELMGEREYALWKDLRPICFQLIKGKKLPLGFQITFLMDKVKIRAFLENHNLDHNPETVTGLYLHFHYGKDLLKAITGTSLSVFTMDKTLEHAWDDMIRQSFKAAGIPFE